MHHVIIEDEQDVDEINFNYESNNHILVISTFHKRTHELFEFTQTHLYTRDRRTHLQLETFEHLWQKHDREYKVMSDFFFFIIRYVKGFL